MMNKLWVLFKSNFTRSKRRVLTILLISISIFLLFNDIKNPSYNEILSKDAACTIVEKKYCNSSIRELTKDAKLGNKEAQFMLALRYENGQSIQKDDEASVFWYRKSAGQKYQDAMYNLAMKYRYGEGVDVNFEESHKLIKLAADLGHSHAQNSLGLDYFNGTKVAKSKKEAFKWFEKAAQSEHAVAQSNLGKFYEYGWGGKNVNYKKAMFWYSKAADKNDLDATYAICKMHRKGLWVKQNDKVAAVWCKSAAKYGHIKAILMMGLFSYEKGITSPSNYKEAIFWWKKAAVKKDKNAYFFLSKVYKKIGDYEESNKWFQLALSEKHKGALRELKENKIKDN